ncbi:MAG TPA: SUMF1/EgtB/PvdO family nonheme iron enzyme [Polyangiaceae bacterium]|nr:SUMF1/EgtB/PvdO family nonheme iron enzyme [Polyangiaceae bacterium]
MRPALFGWRALVPPSLGMFSALLAASACGGRFSSQSDASADSGGASGQAGTRSSGAGSTASTGTAGALSGGGTTSSAGMSSGGGSSAGSGGGNSAAGANAGGAGGSVNECPCAAPKPTCESGTCISRGPAMIKTEGFYIDSTEVTNGEYALFQTAKGTDTSGQVSECSWNDSFDPAFDQSMPMPSEKHPVTNIDFCDAAAYCAWADKRLCGKIGGGDLQFAELADFTKSQWFLACSGTKGQLYPYGPSYQGGYCNDKSGSAQGLIDVATDAKCQGYYPGLFDMIGNAREWVAACNGKAGTSDGCETIGGSYEVSTSCGESSLTERTAQAPELGFRCCSK